MSKAKPGTAFSEAETELIKSLRGRVPTAEIARRLGRSYSGVRKLIAAMDEDGKSLATKPAAESRPRAEYPHGTLGELQKLRDMLMCEMQAAEGPTLARLASEYRATLLEIEKREEVVEGADDDVLGRLADAFVARARQA